MNSPYQARSRRQLAQRVAEDVFDGAVVKLPRRLPMPRSDPVLAPRLASHPFVFFLDTTVKFL